MTVYYFVRDYNNPEKKIYLTVNDILQDIPDQFSLGNEKFIYTPEDVEVELGKINVIVPMFICGFIGLLIHPLGGIIGAIIGLIIGLICIKKDDIEIEKARKGIKRLIKTVS